MRARIAYINYTKKLRIFIILNLFLCSFESSEINDNFGGHTIVSAGRILPN